MSEQQAPDRQIANGNKPTKHRLTGRKKEWKDLSVDPLAEGYDSYQADYVVGKTPVLYSSLDTGQLFSRSKAGRNLHVKLNDGRAICLDTKQPIEIKPSLRQTLQVWLVTSFNSTTASKADF